jgi:uncharacterized protein with HEPN domain
MPPEVDDRALLVDMLEFAREVVAFSKGRSRADLDSDKLLLRSLERALVGECARRMSTRTRRTYASIPWQDIVGMRNIIAHEYGHIDLDEIWKTAQRDAPRLVMDLEMAVAKLPPPQHD